MCAIQTLTTECPVVAAIVAAHNATLAEARHNGRQDDSIGFYAERFGPNFRSIQLAVGRSAVRWACCELR